MSNVPDYLNCTHMGQCNIVMVFILENGTKLMKKADVFPRFE